MTSIRRSRTHRRQPNRRRGKGSRKAETRGLGGLLTGIAKVPQMLQTIWQLAPLVKMFMDSLSKQNQTALPAPLGESEKEETVATDHWYTEKEEEVTRNVQKRRHTSSARQPAVARNRKPKRKR